MRCALQNSLRLYERMRTDKIEPDVVTRTALISAASRAGEWEAALRAFDEMEPTQRNRQTLAAALSACARGGQSARANEILKAMRQAGHAPGIREFTMAAAACKAKGKWREV